MSLYYPALGGVALAIAVIIAAPLVGLGDLTGLVAAGFALIVGAIVWLFSPLPNNNGGHLSGDPGRYWGFRRDGEEAGGESR